MAFTAPAAFASAERALQAADDKQWSEALREAKSGDAVLLKLVTWQYLLDADTTPSFEEYASFIQANPNWPGQKKLRVRAEFALRTSNVPDSEIMNWFADETPLTGVGKLALAEALLHHKSGSQDKITALLRDAWKDGDFEEAEEKKFLSDHGNRLRGEDHIARVDRLLWEEKVTPAKRMLGRVSNDYQKLFKARIALISNKRLAVLAVGQVPAELKKNPGLLYDRMRFRARRNDDRGVREMLLAAPAQVPYPEKWWKYRDVQVREAIDEHNYKLAGRLLANHGQAGGSELADAQWLLGWLKTEFLNDPKPGYEIFYKMYSGVRFPVSKARAAYWAARAADKAGDATASENWYNTATAYPTTFYGQLASFKRNGTAPLHIPAAPNIDAGVRSNFENSDVVRAVKICMQAGETDLANRLISYLVENSQSDSEAALAAGLGVQSGHKFLSVRAAKKALQQQNAVLLDIGYPAPKIPDGLPIDRELVLAITRQESEFDPQARSPSGAIGMMQLMAPTAKETARKNDMKYKRERLSEMDYNIKLGSAYLAHLINNYDGSYIMAIAAYNGGSGNVYKWTRQFGTPGNNLDSAVNWIEKIPFSETRNYVQRVLENLQVYRHIEADGAAPKLMLAEDLVR